MDIKINRLLAITFVSFAALLAGCSDDANPIPPTDETDIPEQYTSLPGTLIDSDTTWNGTLTLRGQYYVLPGVTLTIEPGTTVEWEYHNNDVRDVGVLITLPADDENFEDGPRASGKLIAGGTADNPIVFTSAQDTKQPGDWGGIVLIGDAPNNIPDGGQGEVEGLPQSIRYGGDNEQDNSGSLKYVRIEYVGYGFTTDSEVNGLSLYSVGSGTILEHIQVYKSTDDGFEWFGGNVNAKYLVSMFNDDDSFDMDEGWTGRGQFWLAIQADGADNGFESDGQNTLGSGDPTNPALYNITLIGHGATEGGDDNYGMKLREEFQGSLNNFVIANFGGHPWKVEDDTDPNYTDGSLSFNSMIVWNNGDWDGTDNTLYAGDYEEVDPEFTAPAGYDYRPQAEAAVAGQAPPTDDPFFDSDASYIGAFAPDATLWIFEGNWVRTGDN